MCSNMFSVLTLRGRWSDFKRGYIKHGWQFCSFHRKINTDIAPYISLQRAVSSVILRKQKKTDRLISAIDMQSHWSAPAYLFWDAFSLSRQRAPQEKGILDVQRGNSFIGFTHGSACCPSFLHASLIRPFCASFICFPLFPLNDWLLAKNRDGLGNPEKHIYLEILFISISKPLKKIRLCSCLQ